MQEIEIEKIVLNCGGVAEKLEKSFRLLELITGRKPQKIKSRKRIPTFNLRPGLECGCMVTLRKNYAKEILKKLFSAVENKILEKSIQTNCVSFGIEEYITIPGMEYKREIGMLGLDIAIAFKRKGKRVKIRKIKRGKYPKKQNVTKNEIIEYLTKNFGVEIEQNDSKRL